MIIARWYAKPIRGGAIYAVTDRYLNYKGRYYIMDRNTRNVLKGSIVALSAVSFMGLSSALFATTPTSGQLVVINGLGNMSSSGTIGSSASSATIVVSDATGPCSTSTAVAYNGTVVVKWAASNTHSATSCTSIASVAVTPIKTTVGPVTTIVYDSVSTTTIPAATATAAITYTPPTTAYSNLALIITGTGIPASAVTASATVWGVGAAVAPTFDAGNGSITAVGVPGAIGAGGLKAERLMRKYAVLPMQSDV